MAGNLEDYQFKKGPEHPKWKGGRTKASNGYIWRYAPNHPNRTKQNRVLEHRLVMEQSIGRFLKPDEVVHHINSKRDDNRIENLMLTTTAYNVGISNATRPVTNEYRKKRSNISQGIRRDEKGRFTKITPKT